MSLSVTIGRGGVYMGFLGRIARMGEMLLGAGLAAGALGVWAIAPRGKTVRKKQRASDVPGVYFAHRGLHDSGSGIESDWSQATRDEREYLSVSRQLAVGNIESADPWTNSDAVTQHLATVQSGSQPASLTPENSLPAFAAACQMGYGIELDLHLSRDGQVVVIHDDDLKRVAGDGRKVSDLTYAELQQIPLSSVHGSNTGGEAINYGPVSTAGRRARHARRSPETAFVHVPLLSDVLRLVDGRVPLIVEYKMGRVLDRQLMESADILLAAYKGPYVIESFNPLVLAWYRRYRPSVCRGQLAVSFHGRISSSEQLCQAMAGSLLFNWLGRPDFVAYEWHSGSSVPMKLFRALGGIPVAWTVRSRQAECEAAAMFDHFIFEGYLPSASQ